jgi:hypothetical protein
MMFPKTTDGGAFILAAMGGAILGLFLQSYFEKERKQSNEYLALEKKREAELGSVRGSLVSCPNCDKQLRFDRTKLLLSKPGMAWSCPSCNADISPPQA